jgi:outer membrane usher protein
LTLFRAAYCRILTIALILLPFSARAMDTVIVSVVLNEEEKGEFFVRLTGENDFLIRAEDLHSMGFRGFAGDVAVVDGETHVSLRSIGGVSFVFDERTITLRITAPPAMLPKRTIDLAPQRRTGVLYPRDSGGFLNYGIHYAAGDSFAFRSLDVANSAGVRVGDFLLFSDSTFQKTEDSANFIRLMSSLTWDRRADLTRAVAGDYFASSGDLGNLLNMGGLSYSKVFRIDPYFIRYPLAHFSVPVPFPSDGEIYINGSRVRTQKLSPGEFTIRNLSSYDGAGVVTVVIRDPFGTERRIDYPYYFTEELLRKRLHEYSYNAGFLREDFGIRSNRYGSPAFSGFHRYGVTDSLTLGFRGEGDRDGMNMGPTATYRIGLPGVITASLAGSMASGGGTGAAGLVDYIYQDRRFSARASLRGYTKRYEIAGDPGTERIRYETGAGVSYVTRELGSLSLNGAVTKKYGGEDRKTAFITYSRNLARKATAFLTYSCVEEESTTNDFFVGLTYYPSPDHSVLAGYERTDGADTERLQVQKNQPAGEGIGYRGTVERQDSPTESSILVNPFLQYNGKYGIYTAEYVGEYRDGEEDTQSYRLSASGGVAYVGGTVGFSRPIPDSFGLVTAGGLEGVRVYLNNQEIGRTDGDGRVFLPTLGSYYENQVSIDDRDIPIDYSLSEVMKFVSPPLRSGSLIPFEIQRIQAITGSLYVQSGEKVSPAEYYEVTMKVGEKEISFPTGKGGEFYLENIPPGSYRASLRIPGRPCLFDLVVPDSEEMVVDLGEVTCEGSR